MGYWNYDYQLEYLNPKYDETTAVENFLDKFDLYYEKNIEKTIILKKDEKIIGTGSFDKNVIKALAVSPDYQGQGILNTIVSKLNTLIRQQGFDKIFVYTKAEDVEMFKSMGFKEITRLDGYPVFMENAIDGIEENSNALVIKVEEKIKEKFESGDLSQYITASITVNCNPITKGHLYLIEKTAEENDLVIIFVLSEDLSLFPANIRFELVKKATSHLKNVIVVTGGEYMISHATFPSYFIGADKEDEKNKIFAELDAKVFGEYFARPLKINKRCVGKEPYSPVTAAYNKALKKYLPDYGVEVIEIDRKEHKGQAISASRVREYIRKDKIEKIKALVPEATYNFIKSERADPIIKKIKKTHSRH